MCVKAEYRTGQAGFSLIELILVMVLVGALVGVSAVFILQPFEASEDLERRAGLVDTADLALSRMGSDVRFALPNSVRVTSDGTTQALEFINVAAGARYRRLPGSGSTDTFVPARSSGSFNVIGSLQGAGSLSTGASGACGTGEVACLSVYNMPANSQPSYSAYHGNNTARVTSASGTTVAYDNASFATHSPTQRFYVFDTVVSYVCNTSTGELRRHEGYGLNATQPIPTGSSILIADSVSACSFDYRDGTATRRGLLTMRLEVSRGGESVELLVQAGVMNTP